jgi:hypothetical protein
LLTTIQRLKVKTDVTDPIYLTGILK